MKCQGCGRPHNPLARLIWFELFGELVCPICAAWVQRCFLEHRA